MNIWFVRPERGYILGHNLFSKIMLNGSRGKKDKVYSTLTHSQKTNQISSQEQCLRIKQCKLQGYKKKRGFQ